MTSAEFLYEMRHPGIDKRPLKRLSADWRPTCAVSVKNLIAFTSHADLTKKSRNGNSQAGEIAGTHVYVADLNTPWDCYLVKNSTAEVSNLNWAVGGNLLIGTEDGHVGIYEMSDHLLNKWHVIYEASFPGEPILSSSWLQFPKKVTINPDKIDCMLYGDKYEIRQMHSKYGFGGKSLEGVIVVTATGLLGTVVRSMEDPSKITSSVEKMVAVRNRITCTDMTYSKDKTIVIASSSGKVKQPIQINRANVRLSGSRDKAEIVVTASQSLFLPNIPDHSITALRFGHKANPDVLLVSLLNSQNNSSVLCLYELVSQTVTLKARFHTPGELIPTFRWQQSAQVQFGSAIEALGTVTFPVTSATPASSLMQPSHNQSVNSTLQPLVAVSLSNGAIQLVRYDNFQQVGTVSTKNFNFGIKRERDEPPDSKQMKFSHSSQQSPFVSLQFSWSGSALIALTANSAFSVFKMHPNIDAATATTLIELSMIGGYDPWDVLMCLRQNLVENIVDRLSETFARQPPPVQCYYNVKILVVKAALYRLAIGGLARSNDQQTLLTLNLVSGALKALLRPSALSSVDKGPAEALSALLSSKGESLSDVDQVLIHSEARDYTVEPSTLQSLQQMLQWCADLALKLLATLPDLRHSRAPGWEVCRDSKAVGALRELIVLMRIWGLIRKSCLPSFRRTSENVDILPMLFRLLTRLSVAPHDPDDSLIDKGVVHRPIPETMHKFSDPVAEHYMWLWISLAFAGGVALALFLRLCCCPEKTKNNNEYDPEAQKMKEEKYSTASMQCKSPFTVKARTVQPDAKQSLFESRKKIDDRDDQVVSSSSPPLSSAPPLLPHEEDTINYTSLATLEKRGKPLHFGNYRILSQQISTCDDDGMFTTENATTSPTTDLDESSALTDGIRDMTAQERKSYFYLTSNSINISEDDDGTVLYTSVLGRKDSTTQVNGGADVGGKDGRKGSFAKYLQLTDINDISPPDNSPTSTAAPPFKESVIETPNPNGPQKNTPRALHDIQDN